jgi:hypothetical protein
MNQRRYVRVAPNRRLIRHDSSPCASAATLTPGQQQARVSPTSKARLEEYNQKNGSADTGKHESQIPGDRAILNMIADPM